MEQIIRQKQNKTYKNARNKKKKKNKLSNLSPVESPSVATKLTTVDGDPKIKENGEKKEIKSPH